MNPASLKTPCREFPSVLAVVLVLASVLFAGAVRADTISDIESEARDIGERARAISRQYLGADDFKGKHYAEERLIDGENFYRLKDYQRAAIIFMDIIESYPGHAAYPDALFYFADSLFLSRDFFGARQWFTKLLEQVNKPGAGRFRQKAIGRLIEIAIHLNDFEGIERYFEQLGQTPDAEAYYIKGKYLYFREQMESARREFAKIKGDKELELKAKYFIGVTLTKENRFDEAIEVFKSGAALDAVTKAEIETLDLIYLGLGRLYYEKDFVENASVTYQKVGRYSKYYDMALYEAAAVQIRAGNTIKAERILEVLTLAVPDSMYIPRAKMLRGNLLLRTGRYDEAERVFGETIAEFTPVREQLDSLMEWEKDPGKFFAALTEQSMSSLDVSGVLPPLVVKWVGEEPEIRRAFALSTDLGTAKEYSRETERLVRLLEAVIDGPSRINAIPTLRNAKRRCQTLANRLVQLRNNLLVYSQKKLGGSDAELRTLEAERKQLKGQLASLPTSDEAFKRREEKARAVYQRMRLELSRNIIRLDQLVAMVVALERFIEDPEYTHGATAESITAVKDELVRHKAAVETMREDVTTLKEDVERARYQVGVGDNLDKSDADVGEKIKQISDKERAILRARGGKFGAKLDKVYGVLDDSERIVAQVDHAVVRAAETQIEEIRKQVQFERDRVKRYRAEILVLEKEADEVVGGVTFENFSNVRKKFHELVLKADVGIIDVAWMRKEEHKARTVSLTKDRLAEIQGLDEEFREVRDTEVPAEQ